MPGDKERCRIIYMELGQLCLRAAQRHNLNCPNGPALTEARTAFVTAFQGPLVDVA